MLLLQKMSFHVSSVHLSHSHTAKEILNFFHSETKDGGVQRIAKPRCDLRAFIGIRPSKSLPMSRKLLVNHYAEAVLPVEDCQQTRVSHLCDCLLVVNAFDRIIYCCPYSNFLPSYFIAEVCVDSVAKINITLFVKHNQNEC